MAKRNGSTTAPGTAPSEAVKLRYGFYGRLQTIGAVFCVPCYAYQFPSHTCNIFDIGESMGRFGDALASLDFTPAEVEEEVAA